MSAPDVGRPPVAHHQRENLLGVLAGRDRAPAGADVGQEAQGDFERHRDVIEAVDGNRLLSALDLADELTGESGERAQSFLAQCTLLAQRTQTLAEKFPDVSDGP